jgi:hypothetical protein
MSDPFSNTASDPFMDAGGSRSPSLSFPNLGDSVTGVVTKVDQRDDTHPDGTVKTWPDGKAMSVFIFTLATDDGPVSLWVRGNMVTAVREASRAAGLSTVIGSQLTVQHHALGEERKGFARAKLFRAKFEPVAKVAAPAGAAASAASSVEEPW